MFKVTDRVELVKIAGECLRDNCEVGWKGTIVDLTHMGWECLMIVRWDKTGKFSGLAVPDNTVKLVS